LCLNVYNIRRYTYRAQRNYNIDRIDCCWLNRSRRRHHTLALNFSKHTMSNEPSATQDPPKDVEMSDAAASEPKKKTSKALAPPRFEIKKWNAVAMWSWDICADTCAICRNSLNEPSIEYQANPSPTNDNGLSIAFGNCGAYWSVLSSSISLFWRVLI